MLCYIIRMALNKPPKDRRQALHSLLRTVLHTYLRLLSVLLQGPPSIPSEQEQFKKDPSKLLTTQADQLIEHIKLCTINIHHICNEWRPVQAREMIKLILRNQIEERRERIEEMKSTCDEIRSRLQSLKTQVNLERPSDAITARMEGVALDPQETSTAEEESTQVEDSKKEEAKRKMLAALDAIGD